MVMNGGDSYDVMIFDRLSDWIADSQRIISTHVPTTSLESSNDAQFAHYILILQNIYVHLYYLYHVNV